MSENPNQPGLGGMDFGALIEQAQAMKSQVDDAQQQIAEQTFTGTAGGGKVKVEVSGTHEFTSVKIAPEVVDPDDVEMLEDLLLAALGDANTQMAAFQEEAMGELDMPDMGGLGGMLGG